MKESMVTRLLREKIMEIKTNMDQLPPEATSNIRIAVAEFERKLDEAERKYLSVTGGEDKEEAICPGNG